MANNVEEPLRFKITTIIVITTVIIALLLTTVILYTHGAAGLAAYSLGFAAILLLFVYFG